MFYFLTFLTHRVYYISMKSIPEQIREIRRAAGLSQAELAGMLGLTTGAICNYEKGRRPIRAEAWEKVKSLQSLKIIFPPNMKQGG